MPWQVLLRAYALGIFPMADDRDDETIYWVEPRRRAILPLGGLHLSHSLARTIRKGRFRVTTDTAFAKVIQLCAEAVPGRETTWINGVIEAACSDLFARGHAHSVECWIDDRLVGGLYGIALGNAFFGESMFSRATDASKVALAWLVARLRCGGYTLLDCQFMTEHLQSLGAIEIDRADYLGRLYPAVSSAASALSSPLGSGVAGAAGAGVGVAGAAGLAGLGGRWAALDALLASSLRTPSSDAGSSPGHSIVQLLTNTS
ncbi:MAG: leucyl/phenylalanyl-tRNA--protein transferase [Sphingomonas sp.]